MALFYYQALERNGRKTKGMIEADSARHARQLLRGKDLIPVHIETRMNASAGGMLQRRRHAHRRVAAADLAPPRASWQRWYRQQCRLKPAYRRSVSKVKNCM